jgi:hypothetical protein
VWVFTYLFASLPKNQYPKLWCAPTWGGWTITWRIEKIPQI